LFYFLHIPHILLKYEEKINPFSGILFVVDCCVVIPFSTQNICEMKWQEQYM